MRLYSNLATSIPILLIMSLLIQPTHAVREGTTNANIMIKQRFRQGSPLA